jgi:mannose-1-phosphate guanylyltransferase
MQNGSPPAQEWDAMAGKDGKYGSRFWCVIPAGGSGTRLWPLSRTDKPKFLLPLTGELTLIQQTVDRLLPLSTPERVLVVAGPAHVAEISRQLPDLPAENILVEPAPRGTGPAIGLAALLIQQRDPDAVMGSFAADHMVRDETAFQSAVHVAQEVARLGWLSTIGIGPDRPETGYGYIERTEECLVASERSSAYRALGFTEKPDLDRARQFVDSGRYLWNASMFIWSVRQFVAELERLQPELATALHRIASDWETPRREETLAALWPSLRTVTIDHGIMERTERFAVVPVDMGWSDVGDWHGLGALLLTDERGNHLNGQVLEHGVRDTLVWSTTGRVVAMVGTHNLAIIDTPDALLVLDRDRAQEVRAIVEQLPGEFEDLL